MMKRRVIASLCLLFFCTFYSGCSGCSGTPAPLVGWRTSDGVSAEALFARAVDDLDSGLYPEALKGFSDVKSRFPYSALAPLSDLRIGDTHFHRAKYLEAVDAYRNFLKLHPNHPEGAYALLQIGDAFYEQIPGDWWLLPPSSEKDQASTRRAIAAYEDMLARYPDSALRPLAENKVRQCRRKLADHEIYVARFYLNGGHFQAASARAELILDAYAGVGLDAAALLIASQAYVAAGDPARARASLARLTSEHPESPEAHSAPSMLRDLVDAAGLAAPETISGDQPSNIDTD